MLELSPRRFTAATSILLLLATGLLGLGVERLARGHTVLGPSLLVLGALATVAAFTLRVEGAHERATVILVTRDDCVLCDEARALIRGLQGELELDLWEVDVDADPALAERFSSEVPVLLHDGHVVASMEIRETDLRGL